MKFRRKNIFPRITQPKIRFLGQKMCSVARERTDRQMHTKVTTVGTLSGFQEFFLPSIIKEWPKNFMTKVNTLQYLTKKLLCD